jgi:hypothetical protein
MNKVENNANPVTTEPSYLVGYTNQLRDDEIDLVDLWIVMWSYRKLILSSVILVAVVGILYFEFAYKAKPSSTSTVRSLIEIESIVTNGKRIPVLVPDVLMKRIEFTILPKLSSLSEFEHIKQLIMTTQVSGSSLVEIVNKTPDEDVVDISQFHDQLVNDILLELEKSAALLPDDVHDALFSAKNKIISLKELIYDLEQELFNRANSQATSDQPFQVDIALRKVDIQSQIDLLTKRILFLESKSSNTGSLVLLRAEVSRNPTPPGLAKPVVYSMILMLSIFLGLFLTMGVIFARKVKERMAVEG